ncbi:DUF262 domain-containing protein [Aliarcobacter butzleri]|uniref:DUF262 domain-containing protein n=1 Tax=Aliarcobacter butzleri TaxID=28197 RepID=UPI001EDAD1A3|nr:DUF262 domain-containing protein [Aliarcobacter butzleri]MCG3702675.1 DUF262 domain-containing protein [Aliarcobacter butzleri]
MANWDAKRISDVIELINKEELVLPVVQRELVWDEEKIELLFDTLLKGDSFGGIMTIKDIRDNEPLFYFRPFIKDYQKGLTITSSEHQKLEKDISYVVDGQQRLSAFYIGLNGTYNSKKLYLDLLSESQYLNFNIKFTNYYDKLPKEEDNHDGSKKRSTLWYSVSTLFQELKSSGGQYKIVSNNIFKRYSSLNESEKEQLKDNIELFSSQIFTATNIGLCDVMINLNYDVVQNRQHVVELFRRLNQGGTKLDGLELMASKLKGFDPDNEIFLNDVKEYEDIGFSQDEIIKLIFILRDDHKKSLANIDKSDSDFIKNNAIRIKKSLLATRKFLQNSSLYVFYNKHKPSIIPLYFIVYHLYHKSSVDTNSLEKYFDNFDTNNSEYKIIYKWIYLSLLNRVFRRRGAGWTAYSTGIRKLLEITKKNKNNSFPINEIFEMYIEHPLDFNSTINSDRVEKYDFDFLMYIIYNRPSSFRKNDIDHIFPKDLLEKDGVEWEKINYTSNYQLLDSTTNRGNKSNKEFKLWLNSLPNKNQYIDIHLIPKDKSLWEQNKFEEFLSKRSELMVEKLESYIK